MSNYPNPDQPPFQQPYQQPQYYPNQPGPQYYNQGFGQAYYPQQPPVNYGGAYSQPPANYGAAPVPPSNGPQYPGTEVPPQSLQVQRGPGVRMSRSTAITLGSVGGGLIVLAIILLIVL